MSTIRFTGSCPSGQSGRDGSTTCARYSTSKLANGDFSSCCSAARYDNYVSGAGYGEICTTVQPYCESDAGSSCVSGSADIATSTRGVVPVRELLAGDVVSGLAPDGTQSHNCTVQLVEKHGDTHLADSEFTKGHYIVAPGSQDVVPVTGDALAPTEASPVDVYNIVSTCAAVTLASGSHMTPLADSMCDFSSLSWAQYAKLWASSQAIVQHTGVWWWSPTSYRPAETVHDDGTVTTTRHTDVMRPLCRSMAACLEDSLEGDAACDEFEVGAKAWINTFLKDELKDEVALAYPSAGDVTASSGKLSDEVKAQRGTPHHVYIAVGAAVVAGVAMVTVGVAARVYVNRRRAKQAGVKGAATATSAGAEAAATTEGEEEEVEATTTSEPEAVEVV